MKNKPSPFRRLLLIPLQIIIGFLFILAGLFLDRLMFIKPTGKGHGIPFFTVIFMLIAAAVTVIVVITALTLTFYDFHKQRKMRVNKIQE